MQPGATVLFGMIGGSPGRLACRGTPGTVRIREAAGFAHRASHARPGR